jgi:glycosyltransferase involved in cell wall biosynthesis
MFDDDSRIAKTAQALHIAGHSVVLICWDRTNTYKTKINFVNYMNDKYKAVIIGVKGARGLGYKKLFFSMLLFQLRVIWWLIRYIKLYDIIHACDLDTGICAFIMLKLFRKRFVYDIYDFYADAHIFPKILTKKVRSIECKVIDNAESTIICSDIRIDQISGSNPKALNIIYNSPNSELINFKTPIYINTHDKINIAYVGTLVNGRFIEETMEVISLRNDFALHIGGCGHPSIEQSIKHYTQIGSNIIFYGKMKYEDVISLENSCDIMIAMYDPIIANHKYASPNKFFEALMLGKPIIMVKDTGFANIVEEKGFGVVIEYSKAGLEYGLDTIKKLDFKDISKRMKDEYSAAYSWDEMQSRINNIYQKIKY